MANAEHAPDPLAIDELIRQAEAHKKSWRPPKHDSRGFRGEPEEWQNLMDERLVKPKHWGSR